MVFYENGVRRRYNPYNMKRDKKIGEGEEVVAYQINNEVVKFYKRYCRKLRLTKEMCDYLVDIYTNRILLPTVNLLDKKHKTKAYKMLYVENLGEDSFFSLKKKQLSDEMTLLHDDILTLSNKNVSIEDITLDNIVYNNGIYMIDPGSFQLVNNSDIAYGLNIDIVNEFLLDKVIKRCCFNVSKNYYVASQMLNYIKDDIYDMNMNALVYLTRGIEHDSIKGLAKDKYKEYVKKKCK